MASLESKSNALARPRRRTKARARFGVVATIALAFVAAVVALPIVMPFDPNATNLSTALLPPGEQGFLLGSDAVGRDLLLRTLSGGQESVLTAFAVVLIVFFVGTLVGLIAGFMGGVVDEVLSKIITMFQAFPSFVLAVAIAGILGQGVFNMIIAIAAVYWTQFARLARSLAMSIKDSDSVRAARVCGARTAALMRKYILPNIASPLIVMAALSVGDVILTMAGLSFLGLGPERPTNEWGAMMSEARSTFQFAPWGIVVPGVALFIAVIIFNLLGDSLRDVLDARCGEVPEDVSDRSSRKRKGKRMNMAKAKRSVAATAAAVCLAFAVLISGCSSSGTSETTATDQNTTQASEKVLRGGSTAYFYATNMDPADGWNGWEMEYYGIAENVLKLTDDFETEAWLATSVESIDDTTWQIELRDDVTFSNGEKMTGDAVKACWERTYEVNSRAAETLAIESIEADGQTVTVTTTEAVPSFKNIICDPIFCVYYVGDGIDYETDTPCTGPYVMSEFVYEDITTLVPNENYWDGTPQLDRIELNTYFDDDSMVMAMQNGELDVLAMPGASAYTTLNDTSKYQVLAQTSTRADFVRFNMAHPVVANDAVRTAVSYCIDREGYANTICAGTEVPSYGVYSAQLPYGGTDGLNVTVDACDTDAAAAVLDEAGLVDSDGDGVRELDGAPIEITLYNCSTYERFVNLADDLQSKLASIGIKLNITTVDYWLQDSETYAADDPDMTIDSYGMAPTGDADYFASMCFVTGGSNNFGSYSNTEVDSLVAQLEATFDETEREGLIKQISQHVLDDSAYIFFSNSETSYIATTNVQNIAVAPSEYYFITVDTTIA